MPAETDPLRPHPDDELHRMARAIIGTVPGLGSILKEMFTGIIADPAQRRRDDVIRDVLLRLKRLEDNSRLSLVELANREEFVATFIRMVQAASREVEKEKIRVLKNAIITTALRKDSLEDSVQAMLLNVLEQATIAHITMLHMFRQNERSVEEIVLESSSSPTAYNERVI